MKASMYLAALLVLAGCQSTPPDLRLNQVQLIGSHNSYKRAIDPSLLAVLAQTNQQTAIGLDYSHLPLPRQLDLGIRKLELDLFHDPQGGRYASPMGLAAVPDSSPLENQALLNEPGFKVFHVQDIDFRSHCALFKGCLTQLVAWSDAHPGHFPVFILINAKDQKIPQSGFVEPLAFDSTAWDLLDAEIREVMKEKLVTPDLVKGKSATLREAVMLGWPRVNEMKGKFLFVLDDSSAKKAAYAKDHPSLSGRAMFIDADSSQDEAAIMVMNEPGEQKQAIESLVRQGYIVRTRADADTREARTGDTTRRTDAFASGAQIISTDYYVPDPRFKTGYQVSLPGGGVARCHPMLTNAGCRFLY